MPSRSLAVASLLVMLSPASLAQGLVYRERWGYLHLEHRRDEVLGELVAFGVATSPAELREVGELLAEPDGGVPFRPVAAALARLRGAELDDAAVLRAAASMFVLPEVVDPDADVEACRNANFTVFLPCTVPAPGALSFELEVRAVDGEVVWTRRVDEQTSVEDLRKARPSASFAVGDLPDGSYSVAMTTFIDGAGPRPGDPRPLRWTFHVQRGYQARCVAAVQAAVGCRADLNALERALLDGLALSVSRAYTGEAFDVDSFAVRELELLERGLANVAAGTPPLAGAMGVVRTALPAGDEVQPCVLRLPPPDDAAKPAPLVVFVSGAPSYDAGARRPIAPATRSAAWLARVVGGFGLEHGWNVAVVDSPGGGRAYPEALLAALRALPEVLPTGGRRPLLVCDREAAAVVALRAAEFAPHVGGLVLFGAGAIPPSATAELAGLPVRYVELEGYGGSAAIGRMLDFAARQPTEARLDMARLHDRALPWTAGVALSLAELERFAADVFRAR